MLTVLLLAGVEKLVNLAIRSDEITRAGLVPLSGKVLRLTMQVPALNIDVLFNDNHLRFEPVAGPSVFEPRGFGSRKDDKGGHDDSERARAGALLASMGHSAPDCTIKVANLAELLNLMRSAEGNLPIEGDYKVLMQLKQLIAGFDPDVAGQLEPLIGVPLASQLNLLIRQLKGTLRHTAKHTFDDVADWANDVAGNARVDPAMEAEVDELKQQLLKLRADIEREEARLDMIKAEQARLRLQNPD